MVIQRNYRWLLISTRAFEEEKAREISSYDNDDVISIKMIHKKPLFPQIMYILSIFHPFSSSYGHVYHHYHPLPCIILCNERGHGNISWFFFQFNWMKYLNLDFDIILLILWCSLKTSNQSSSISVWTMNKNYLQNKKKNQYLSWYRS